MPPPIPANALLVDRMAAQSGFQVEGFPVRTKRSRLLPGDGGHHPGHQFPALAPALDRARVTPVKAADVIHLQAMATCSQADVLLHDPLATGWIEAVELARLAVHQAPDLPRPHAVLAVALIRVSQPDEALEHAREAIRIDPESAMAQLVTAQVLFRLGRMEEAERHCELALQLRPGCTDARTFRARTFLANGDFRRGWDGVDAWRTGGGFFAGNYPLDRPFDTADLAGRTIRLHEDAAGFGDQIQFLRYAAPLAEMGASVIAAVHPTLAALASSAPGVARVVPLYVHTACDYSVPYISLPRLLGTNAVDRIPSPGQYLSADPARVQYWRMVLGAEPGFKVGIAWQGDLRHPGDCYRSVPVERFTPLLHIPGVRLVSLQKGAGRGQLERLRDRPGVLDLGARTSDDLADVAALMHALDLFIGVDSSLVHLAGALQRPVWVALAEPAEWRWLRDRSDSPWYQTMKLFRQPRPGDWESVFDTMRQTLTALAGTPL